MPLPLSPESYPKQEDAVTMATLLDVDGTLSDTRVHMEGYNQRLAVAFPEIPPGLLEELGAARVAYRKANAGLTHAEQSAKWQESHPGLMFDSQTSFFEGEAPDIFTPDLMRRIREWGAEPENFGHGEYEDVAPLIPALRRIGAFPLLFTLGSRERVTGEPGWQERKVLSAPSLRGLARHIAETLPGGGKGSVVGSWYRDDTDDFLIPRTDDGEPVRARGAVLVDDVPGNVENMPGQAMGVLLDRTGKHEGKTLPTNVRVARSLNEVPALIEEYRDSRYQQR